MNQSQQTPTKNTARDTAQSSTIDARSKLVIGLLLISTFVVILNETLMGVALPTLIKELHIPPSTAQWLTAAVMLTMAVVIPITGYLLQRFNTRPLFITAMSLFSLGTLLAIIAPSFDLLLVARVVQASGTGIMLPLLMTTVMTLVPEQTRGRTMGSISIVISVAPAIGPTISGLILYVLDWRWMFAFILPIAIAALVIGTILMKNVTEPTHTRVDILSVVLSALGFGGLVYGLSVAGTAKTPFELWIPVGVGAISLALFITRQLILQRSNRALLDLRTFGSRQFTLSIVLFAILMPAMFGAIVLLPIYMVDAIHETTLATGLTLLPGGLIMGLISPPVGRIYDRFGPTWLVVAGTVVGSAGLWGMTLLTGSSSIWAVLACHVTLSIGFGLAMTPLFTTSLGALRPQLYSHGSAIVGTVQQLGGAAGTALLVAIMSVGIASSAASGSNQAAATAAGTHSAFIWAAVISLIAIPFAFFIRKPGSPGAERGSASEIEPNSEELARATSTQLQPDLG
jgi:DHA2 family lincomycin resistance protein-like MFS transporter